MDKTQIVNRKYFFSSFRTEITGYKKGHNMTLKTNLATCITCAENDVSSILAVYRLFHNSRTMAPFINGNNNDEQ